MQKTFNLNLFRYNFLIIQEFYAYDVSIARNFIEVLIISVFAIRWNLKLNSNCIFDGTVKIYIDIILISD